ncbi:unnamed protein product [Symbiodinium natans]|uniref:Uncharacterized protein n=1 Tax=Symbiodinium natans TaxID=878477 RepID=A0A812RYX4_9DINO|nr:unnamed protein product [Symbiodinium natans]
MTLQRLADLLVSGASKEEKMAAGAEQGSILAHIQANDAKEEQKTKMPKTLARIKEERLASKEQLKAVNHILQQLQTDLDSCIPEEHLHPVSPDEEIRMVHESKDGTRKPYIVNRSTGQASWDVPRIGASGCHTRLSLCPDEGSALYAVYEYLCSQNVAVMFNRDSLQPN